jgi:hypothetical protein
MYRVLLLYSQVQWRIQAGPAILRPRRTEDLHALNRSAKPRLGGQFRLELNDQATLSDGGDSF